MDYDKQVYFSKKASRISKKKNKRVIKLARASKKYSNGGLKNRSMNLQHHRIKRKFMGYMYFSFNNGLPEYNDVIKFLLPKFEKFSERKLPENRDGVLIVPKVFSISEETEESMYFLKRLFSCLYTQEAANIYIDYQYCIYLDVDASACMDLMLDGFIKYYESCLRRRIVVKIQRILPVNFENNPEVANVLFSIGAYKNIRKFKINNNPNNNFIPFNLRLGDSLYDKKGIWKEIHETQIVDYVIKCLAHSGHKLTPIAEANISKVVGEVMANAEEHSNFRFRYAIGYFLKPDKNNNKLGIFKLSIFNFGQTIYESFSNSNRRKLDIVHKMSDLSQKYTKNGFFRKAKYEEETLWTLYSLQEGVTSLPDWKRGKGTIRFIDRFFKLKGDDCSDDISRLTLLSGNSKIIFDGSYPLKDKPNDMTGKPLQVMTFNNSGDITQLPDEKFVKFVPQTFPGTLITVKICITDKNIL